MGPKTSPAWPWSDEQDAGQKKGAGSGAVKASTGANANASTAAGAEHATPTLRAPLGLAPMQAPLSPHAGLAAQSGGSATRQGVRAPLIPLSPSAAEEGILSSPGGDRHHPHHATTVNNARVPKGKAEAEMDAEMAADELVKRIGRAHALRVAWTTCPRTKKRAIAALDRCGYVLVPLFRVLGKLILVSRARPRAARAALISCTLLHRCPHPLHPPSPAPSAHPPDPRDPSY